MKETIKNFEKWLKSPFNVFFLGFISGLLILPILEGFPLLRTLMFLEVAQFLMLIYFLFFREKAKKK